MTSILIAAMLMRPAPALPQPDKAIMFLPAVQFEAPSRITAGLSVFFPTKVEPGPRSEGYIVEARAGQRGGRVSFGRVGYLEYLGLDTRVFVGRTWGDPLNASTDSTYAGVEGGMTIAYVRVAVGVARRVSGPSGPHGTVFTWSAGVHLPIFR